MKARLRYEDVMQDGRLVLTSLSSALGDAVWREEIAKHPGARAMLEQGIVPILSRLVLEAGEQRVGVDDAIDVKGSWELAHTVDATGAVERLLMIASVDAHAPRLVGRLFAEHVITRPFGPPEQRKVSRLDVPGVPEVPEKRVHWRAPIETVRVEADEPIAVDEAPFVFAMLHTDSNQHVNSLVYPRLAEEAAARVLASIGTKPAAAAVRVEAAYRKPCFAGERVVVQARAYAGGLVTVVVADEGAPLERARAYVRLQFA